MNTVTAFLAASLLYAAIPFALLILDRDPTDQAATIISLTIAISTTWCLIVAKRLSLLRLLFNGQMFVLSTINLIGILAFIWLVSFSRDSTGAIFTLVIVESWPLAVAVAFPFLSLGAARKVDLGNLLVASIAIFGIALIGFAELNNQILNEFPNLLGFIVPVAAMLSMTISTLAKAKYVAIAKKEHDIGPINSFFLMYMQSLPFLPILLIVVLRNGYDSTPATLIPDMAIVGLNIGSAILFSFGTLWLRDNRDWFVWFFAPVFSVAFFCIYQTRLPEPLETVGIGLIVGSNLLLSLSTDNRLGYRYAIICLMIIGAFCAFQPLASFDQYYDTLAVLSIFVSITLAFMLGRVSSRAELELALFQQAIDRAVQNPAAVRLFDMLTRFQRTKEPVRAARLHQQLIRLPAPREVIDLTRQIGISRRRGMRITNLFSLTTSVVAIVVIVILCRPVGWQHDFFALMFAPSVIYAYFYLIDLDRSRYSTKVKLFHPSGGQMFATLAHKRRRFDQRNTLWSVVLIGFLILNFIIAFSAKLPAVAVLG